MKAILTSSVIFTFSFLTVQNSLSQIVWNQACRFNGASNSYIAIPHSTSLDITGAFSLEACINPVNSTSPAVQIILQKREGIHNSGYSLLLNQGKVAVRSNQNIILTGKTVIPNNQWTHVAATFSGSTFFVYINGVADTSRVFNLPPVSNTDSLFIGKGFNSPFNGLMDEVRVLNASYNEALRKISFSTSSGYYSPLKLSLTFQNLNPAGTLFSLTDFSGNNNNGVNRGVTAFDMSNSPNSMTSVNECYHSLSSNYLKGSDHPNVSPVSGITVEAWIWPEVYSGSVLSTVVHKGTPSGSRMDYAMRLNLNKFEFYINETKVANIISTGELFPLRKWTHVAFTYNGANGFMQFIRNGMIEWDDTNFVGNIHDNSDSLFVGGTSSLQNYFGYLDELRITSSALSYETISNNIFTSINESNDPLSTNVVYNFDGGLSSNSDSGPTLIANNSSGQFSHNAYFGGIVPISPLTNSISTNFPGGYYTRFPYLKIPESGTSGFMKSDTLYIPINETITDVNVYVALNHTDEDDLIISLISPSGISTTLYSTSALIDPSDHVITIFDDQADSSLGSNKYLAYTPIIRSLNNLNSALSGTNTLGKWMLKIQDAGVPDSGRLIGWGIQFNDQIKRKSVLSLTALIQGFYDASTNSMVTDTMRVFARNNFPPYNIIDSSKEVLSDSGTANFIFNNVSDGVPVYILLKHRNSIETWSKDPSPDSFAVVNSICFKPMTSNLDYDFSDTSSSAFGNNMTQVDASPVRFAIYSGDENQDGIIDAADMIDIYNDVLAVTAGYVRTDVNGDDFVDVSDLIITYNNAINIVSVVTP